MISGRAKGRAFEQQIARDLRPFFPKARRGLQFQDNEFCPDIVKTDFFIECKRGNDKHLTVGSGKKARKYNPNNGEHLFKIFQFACEQRQKYVEDGEKERPVILIWKLNRQPIKITALRLDIWDVLTEYLDGKSGSNATNLYKRYGDMPILTIDWEIFIRSLSKIYSIEPVNRALEK